MSKKLLLIFLIVVATFAIYKSELSMASKTEQKKFYNLSTRINENMVVFPGEPSVKIKKFSEINEKNPAELSFLSFVNHIGTHVDYPSHVIKNAKNSSDFTLENLIDQPGIVIEVPNTETSISKAFLEKQKNLLTKDIIVFFKTKSSDIPKTKDKLSKNFVALEPDAAAILVKAQVKAVGIDYLSIDKFENGKLPVHKELLLNNILIIENLELKDIPAGEYLISIAPLQLDKVDGAPATVYAKTR